MLNTALLLLVFLFVIFVTTKLKLHPFLTLLFATILIGFLGGLDSKHLLDELTKGFGNTLKNIGIVIACGTIIGTFLERGGGTNTIAAFVVGKVGERRAPLAMSITGFIVSIPVFCDSGFVILSTINKALSKKTGISLAVLAVALSTGLYTTHVFVPPTPGPLAAAGTLGADIGLVLILGLVVAVPTAAAGLLWALFVAVKFPIVPRDATGEETQVAGQESSVLRALGPLFLPLVFISLRSVANYPTAPMGEGSLRDAVRFIGDPNIALLVGVLLVLALGKHDSAQTAFRWVTKGLENAGAIILITGAGGAFGNILSATGIANSLAKSMGAWQLGIVLPFAIAAILKTAQGSSTVAIITTAGIVSPLLEPMDLVAVHAKALVVLAIGAGAMTVSHFNDSYFWVVSQFSEMDSATALRCHTGATLVQGVVGITTIVLMAILLA